MKALIALCCVLLYPFPMSASPQSESTLQEKLGYKRSDILVIVHADDIGMHPDETAGAMGVLGFGMARTGSVLVPAPDFSGFAELWKKDPALDIGVHVCLNSEWDAYRWPPVLPRARVPSLFDPEGFMWKRQQDFTARADEAQAILEMRAQVEKVMGMGLAPTHMDPHMGSFYYSPVLFRAAVDIAVQYNLVIPFVFDQPARKYLEGRGLVTADDFSGFYQIPGEEAEPGLRRAAYESWLKGLSPGVHFIYIHPAKVTRELEKLIETPYVRSGDLEIWTSPQTRRLSDGLGIRFIGLRELQVLQAKNLGSRT